MTTDALDRFVNTRAPARQAGQATLVEQSRAVAEVQAAVVVAQQCPRNVQAAIDSMRESCRQPALANRAFFRFTRGGSTVAGPSVHLARELARCWGNMQAGVAELRRDDQAGESEMLAYAWDVQTNARASTTFIVPHLRDTKKGAVALTDVRDIYENNANHAARRLREMIFSILPPWFVEEAKDLCEETLRDGGGKPLAQRIADAVRAFDSLGVSPEQLERRVGRGRDQWTPHDIAELTVVYQSLNRGETSRDEEFPVERSAETPAAATVTAALRQERPRRTERDVEMDAMAEPAVPPQPVDPEPPASVHALGDLTANREAAERAAADEGEGREAAARSQLSQISVLLGGRHGLGGQGSRRERQRILSGIVQRHIATPNELSRDEAQTVIGYLENTATADLPRLDPPAGPVVDVEEPPEEDR